MTFRSFVRSKKTWAASHDLAVTAKTKPKKRDRERKPEENDERKDAEPQVMWVFLCRSGVSKQCQPLTVKQVQWRLAPTHTHLYVIAHAKACAPTHGSNAATQGCICILVCVRVCLRIHNRGSVWEARSGATSNEKHPEKNRRPEQKWDKVIKRADEIHGLRNDSQNKKILN